MDLKKKILLFIFVAELAADCEQAEDPSRVIVAGGSLTEIIFFLEEERVLTAVDITSNYPESATSLPSIGYVRALSTEGILSLNPTLILGEEDMGPPLVVDQIKLTGVDLRVIEEDYSLNSIKNKIICVAKILGIEKKGEQIFREKLNNTIIDLQTLSLVNQNNLKKVLIILSMDGTSPIVAGKNTSANGFIQMMGAENAVTSFDGWKPVGAESIIQMNPDMVIITERGIRNFESINEFIEKTSLGFTSAGKNGKIFALDGMKMLGFGPRSPDTALELAKIIN